MPSFYRADLARAQDSTESIAPGSSITHLPNYPITQCLMIHMTQPATNMPPMNTAKQ